jgi:predicted nucleic acid-binding protein
MELYSGARTQREERRIDTLLASFDRVAIDDSIFRLAGSLLRHYRASSGIDFPDALIAATAEHHGLELATLNVKHFPMFKGLKPAY